MANYSAILFISFLTLTRSYHRSQIHPSQRISKLYAISTRDSSRELLLKSAYQILGAVMTIPLVATADDNGILLSPTDASTSGIDTSTNGTPDSNTSLKDSVDFAQRLEQSRPLCSDEFEITFEGPELGLAVSESSYQGFPVCTVSKILDQSIQHDHSELRVGAVVTIVNGIKTDGIPLRELGKLIKAASRPLVIRFRDPSRYFELLDSTKGTPLQEITSSYLPANARDAGAPEQIIRVRRLDLPSAEQRLRLRPCELNDVLEIQYVAQVAGSKEVVDSSAERGPPGSSSRSIYYVLGQRNGPPGRQAIPPGWDLTLRGMVVGERRRIELPYTLAFERKGVKERNIPPFATMVYTVKLLSLT